MCNLGNSKIYITGCQLFFIPESQSLGSNIETEHHQTQPNWKTICGRGYNRYIEWKRNLQDICKSTKLNFQTLLKIDNHILVS